MKSRTFKITQELIDAGIQKTKGQCAVALALTTRDDDLYRPYVTEDVIRVSDRFEEVRYEWTITGTPLSRWIKQWDEDAVSSRPMTFHLYPQDAKVSSITRYDPVSRARREKVTGKVPVKSPGSRSRRLPKES